MRKIFFTLLLLLCATAFAQTAEVSYSDDFQSYGSPANPPGWVDKSIGGSIANGLYKTWLDPLHANNIVFGTKQASGKPEGNNPRIGTFSTLTTKSFNATGRFEYRGRFLRTNDDTRVGLTFFSSYPETDKYYLLGTWTQPATGALTMQLFAFGAGTLAGTVDSNFTPLEDKWYRFLIQVDDAGGATHIRARFWLDGSTEPTAFTIDASDAATTRLTQGRIGIWSAVKGDAFVDDLFAQSPVDHTAPVLTFFEGGLQLSTTTTTPLDHDARVDVHATDDLSGIAKITATADGQPYTPLSPITAEGTHTIHARADDYAGNFTEGEVKVLVDKTNPVVTLTANGVPLPLPIAKFKTVPSIGISVSDAWTGATYTATLDGQPYVANTPITAEGTHYLSVEAVDGVKHKLVVPATILVDLSAPAIAFYEHGVKLGATATFKVDPSIEVRLTDAFSKTEYTATLDGNAWKSLDPIPAEGWHKIVVSAVDEAGNTSSTTLDVLVDKAAPVVVLKERGVVLDPAVRAVFARDAAIEILISDATSKVTSSATLNGSAYTSLDSISAERNHTLVVHAADEAGNLTDVTLQLLIDKTAPAIAFYNATTLLDPRDLQKFRTDAAITIKVTDAFSTPAFNATIDGAPYTPGSPITNENEHVIVVTTEDDAHNPATATLRILVDKTKPTIAFSVAGAPLDATQKSYGSDVKVDIAVSDNLPGVTSTAKLDGADYVSGATISSEGPHTITVHAIDRAENVSDAETKILIDKSGPAIAFYESNAKLDAAKRQDFNRLPSIDVRITDALLTYTSTITIDGGVYVSNTPVAEGLHTINVHAVDALNNATDAKLELLVDKTAPVVVLKEGGNALPASGAIFARDITVVAAITDISKTETTATLDGQPFSLALPISAEGEHTLAVTVTDELKWSTTVSAQFTIDKTPPKFDVIAVVEGTTPVLQGAKFARDSVTLNAIAYDLTPVTFTAKIDDAPYILGTPYTIQGTHTIFVEAEDAAHNKSSVSILFHLQKDAPEVRLLESGQPLPANKTFTRDVIATVDVTSATTTTNVATIDGQPYNLGDAYVPEGRHHLKVVVTNQVDLSTTVEADFAIDRTPPTIKLFAAPNQEFTADMRFKADVTPSTEADDNLSKPPKVVVLLDNQQLPPGTVVSEEKVHTISATATDDGGLSKSVGPFTFVLDKTAPKIEVLADDKPLKDGDQFNKTITPVVQANDLTTTTITLTLDEHDYAQGTAISDDGQHTLVVKVKDDLGNETAPPPIHFVIDKTAPVVSVLESDQPFSGGKFKRNLKPVVVVSDLTQTITNATLDGNPWTSGQEISSEGHHTLEITVTDELQWVTVVPPIAFTIDKSAPVVAITESGAPLVTDTIFNRNAAPKIVASDTTNVTIEATLDGAPFTSEMVVTSEARHTLVVKATDELGFVTDVPPVVFTVDKTPPAVTITENGAALNDNALLNHNAVPNVAVSDLTPVVIDAKVDGQTYALGAPITAEGAHTFEVVVTDAAGWKTTPPAIHFVIDKTAPVVAINVNGAPLVTGAEFAQTIAPTITITDLSATTTVATLDGNPWTSGAEIAAEGEHVLNVAVTDAAGWKTTVPPITFIVDKSAPVVRVLEKGVTFASGTKFNRDVEPKIVIDDLTKTTIDAKLDGSAWTPDTLITAEGAHTLTLTVTDHLGHPTVVPPIAFTIDKTAPVVVVTESGQPLVTGSAFNRNVKPEIAVTDITSTTTTALLNAQPYTFGTEISAEAKYTLTATVTDELNWSTSIPAIVFFIDKTPPTVTLMEGEKELASGTWFNRDVIPRAVIKDTTETTTSATLNDQAYDVGTPITAEGTYTLKVKVTDKVGLVTEVPAVTFTIDKTPPALAFTNPIGNAKLVTREVIVTGDADDAIQVDVNGVAANVADKKFVTPEAIPLEEGENVLTATGFDRAGNSGTVGISVFVDTRAPEVRITAPANNACVDAAEVAVSGEVIETALERVRVTAGATAVDATLSADKRTFTASLPLAEGRHTINVEALDAGGHTAHATVNITVDRTKPVVEILESGTRFTAAAVNRAVAPILRVNEANAVITAALDGQPYASGTAIASDGAHEIKASAKDCAGHVSDEVVQRFVIDRAAPQIASIVPANNATVRASTAITGTLSEPASVVIDGTTTAASVNGVNFTLNASLHEGANAFVLSVTDAAGNQTLVPYTLNFDSTAPSVEIVIDGAPIPANAIYTHAVAPVVRSNDAHATITATLNGNAFTSGTSITADGSYTLTAKASDASGNESATATATFRIDRTGPSVHITSPANGAILNAADVEVRGTITDARSVTINGVTATLATDSFTARVPLDLGSNLITAVAIDSAGNTSVDSIDVTRDAGSTGLVLTAPPDHMVTNRATTVVAGQVLNPSAPRSVSINGVAIPVDPAGVFRKIDFALVEGTNTITAAAGSTSVSVTVTADFTPPALKVNANGVELTDGLRFAASPAITIETDNGVTPKLTIDGEEKTPGVIVLADGGHALTVIARDAAGNETRVDRVFFIGNAASASGCALSSFDPIDGSAVFSETVRINGRSGGAASVLINGFAASVSDGSFCGDATLAPGRNEVRIQCADASGHATNDSPAILVLYRFVDPTITIASPNAGAIATTSSINVTGTVGAGVVNGDVNGIAFTVPDDGADSHPFSVSVPLTPGLNVITARGMTKSYRAAVASTRVKALIGAPQIAITSPLTASETGATAIDISGTYTNVDPSTIVVGSQIVTTTRHTDTSGTFRATVALPGAAVTTFTVTGRNGASVQASANVAVQNSPGNPSIAIDTPSDNTYLASTQTGALHVTGSVTAPAAAQVSVNGVAATITGTTFAADVDLPASASGITPVIARVTDTEGKSATDSIRVVRFAEPLAIKNTFPESDATAVERGVSIIVVANHPLDGATVANALRVTDANNANVDGDVFVDRDAITFAPNQPLKSGTRYTVSLATSLKDVAGAQLPTAYSFAFTAGGSAPSNAPIVDDTQTTGCFSAATITGRVSTPGARAQLEVDGVKMTTQSSDSGAFKFTFTFSGQSGYHIVRVRELGADGSLSAERALCYRISCATPQVLSATLDRNAKTIAIQFSKSMDRASLDSAIVVTDSDSTTLNGTIALANDLATITFASIPAKNILLTVKKSAKDSGGAAMSADYTQTFTYSTDPTLEHGKGYITGAVYDATNGRPLAGAQISILHSQFAVLNSNDRGKYAIALAEGAYTLEASAPNYTTVWRQVVVPSGAGVVPIDIRLTKRGTGLTNGNETKLTKKVELTFATPLTGHTARVTSLGGQSLAGLLPLGWSPLASAEIAIDDSPLPVSIPGARITFTVDANAITAAAQTLALVQYDSERDEWRVVTPVVNVASDGRAAIDINTSGDYALVYADKNSGLVARAGASLKGAPNPCTTTPDNCKVIGKTFTLDPKAVLPNGRTVATLTTDGAKPYPSGTAVQAFIDEQLNLADGGTLVDPPFATDLLIYRTLAGSEGVADFHLAPTARATLVTLRDGVDHIRIVDYPGRIDRGTLLGAEGGRVPADDGITIDVPAGATAEPLHASAASMPATEIASFGSIAGFHIAGGFTFTLTRANEPSLPQGTSLDAPFLLIPAKVSVAATNGVIVEVLPNTQFGVLFRLVAILANGTTRPIVSTELPLDGVVRDGRYLILTADAPIAYAYGQVRSADNVALANARVTADSLGVKDLTRIDGLFVVPVLAKPAAPFSLIARTTTHGDGAPAVASASPDPGAFVNFGTLTLAPQPPQLVSITPANNSEVDASAVVVQATFDRPIDPASIAGFSLGVPGTSVMNGSNTIRFSPAEPLRPGTRYAITVGPSIRGMNGTPFGRTLVSQFTTRAIPAGNTSIHRERIRITIPDANGKSTISGIAGSLPAGAQAIAVRRGRLFVDAYQTTVASDGSFAFDAGVNAKDRIATSDTIDLQVLDSVSHAIVAIIELTPFVSADGKGFLAPAGRTTTFTSADDITVTVPAGAFDTPTLVRVAPAAKSAFADVQSIDNELTFGAAVSLQFDGIARQRLEVELPAPANTDANRTWLLGYHGESMRGPKIELVDFLRVANNKFTTALPVGAAALSGTATAVGSGRHIRTNAFSSDDLRRMVLGAIRAGSYNAFALNIPAGWTTVSGVSTDVELFSYFESLYVSKLGIMEKKGTVLMPVPAGRQFTVVGVDASSGLESFRKTYDPIAEGTPAAAVSIPSPIDNDAGPLPVYVSPARLDVVETAADGVRVDSVRDLEVVVENGLLKIRNIGSESHRIAILNAATTTVGSADVGASAQSSFGNATPGDRVLVTYTEEHVNPELPIAVVFDQAIYTGAGDANAYLHANQLIALKSGDDPSSLSDITDQVTFHVDSRGTRVTLVLSGALQRGKLFALILSRNLAAHGNEGLHLAQRKIDGTNGPMLASDFVFWFRTSAPAGEIRETSLASGTIRDFAMNGNVAVVSATDGALQTFDMSDPAAIDGARPAGRLLDDANEYWAVATDRHGRIFSTGVTPALTFLHSYRLDDFLPSTPGTTRDVPSSKLVGSAMLTWRAGFASSMPLSSSTAFFSDRPESLPRRMQLAVIDNELPMQLAQLGTPVAALANGFRKYNASIAADPQLQYPLQRITIENRTQNLRWSADAQRGGTPAQITGIIARDNDELFIVRNQITYAVIALFGYGIGVWDVNAVESNDRIAGSRIRETVVLTDAKNPPSTCRPDPEQPPCPIRDLSFTPEALVRAEGSSLVAYALESNRGVLDVTITPPRTNDAPPPDVFDGQAVPSTGLSLGATSSSQQAYHPRLRTLREQFVQSSGGRQPRARFNSISDYQTSDGGNYALVATKDFGIAVLKLDGTALGNDSLVDVIWIPAGAYSVRVMPGTDLAVAVDGAGRVLLIDLKRIDESAKVAEIPVCNSTCPMAELFPTALGSIKAQGAPLPVDADWTEVGADDPRILWKSKPHLVRGTLAPLADADTGFLLAGDANEKKLHVVSATDPRLRVIANSGTGELDVAGIVPLGVAPPPNAPVTGPDGSLAAFHLELTLPGAIAESLPGNQVVVAVESERVLGADTEQTPAPYPPSHLRLTKRDGTADARPATIALRRVLPTDANDPDLVKLRYQRGFNRLASKSIVAIADPRATKEWSGSRGDCVACERPASLTDFAELYTLGRYIDIRPDTSAFGGTSYAFLAGPKRIETRVSTIPADTVRPAETLVAAQHPPVAEGMLQETTYLHSGELESSAVDYDAGGRAGWNVAFDRTYRSRTIGLSSFGAGWDSSLFKRLRPLPDGDVEYRDGAGELWLFRKNGEQFNAPQGLFLKLTRDGDVYTLIDQQLRLTTFDGFGRVVAESDEFHELKTRESGNTIRYYYDNDGRLSRVVDPAGRESTLTWDRATGLLKEIADWHQSPRRVTYDYDAQRRLTGVRLPEVANTSNQRPAIRYAYKSASATVNDQLERATNLDSITDPNEVASNGTYRVRFDYDDADRVTKQTWGSGESATFAYGTTRDVTDVLGQLRRYSVTANTSDLLADRAHATEVREIAVPVWNGAAFGQLPSAITAGTATTTPMERVRRFTFDSGVVKSASLDGVREMNVDYKKAFGAPGLLVSSTTASGTASPSISRVFNYQSIGGGETFLQSIESGGKRIESPMPSRVNLSPVANNSGIAASQTFDTHGLPMSASSTGGTDTASAGAKSSIEYFAAGAAPHERFQPHSIHEGDGPATLTTTIEYPSETQTKETDARGVVTTTDFDAWQRPVRVQVNKPGETLAADQRFFYDASGRLARQVEKKGSDDVTTTFAYDVMGRRTSSSVDHIATVGTSTTTTQYDLTARKIVTTSPGGAVMTTDLDSLGRARRSYTFTGSNSSPIEQQFAYDLAGNRVYTTDMFTASAAAFDAHGRAVATKAPDGTTTKSEYDEWDRPKSVKSLADDGTTSVAESTYDFTDAGRLRSMSTKVDAGVDRLTSYAWDGGGRTTRFATNGRAAKSAFDVAGRITNYSAGAGDLNALTEIFDRTDVASHDGAAPAVTKSLERGQSAATTTSIDRNALGDVTRNAVGPLEWSSKYDELGNVIEASVPARPSSKYDVDARGAVATETLPDGAKNEFAYDANGAQKNYSDPTNEATGTQTDLIGRPLVRTYPDGTTETIQWEGPRVHLIRDRQGREQVFKYNVKGQLEEVDSNGNKLETLGYDNAGRLVRWTNADSEITWSDFDLDGNPKRTTQKRFRNGSGFGAQDVLNEFVQEHRWNEHGERKAFSMPWLAGQPMPAGWTKWIHESHDAMGNVTQIARGNSDSEIGAVVMTGTYRSAGRPQTRTVFAAGNATPIVRTYAYDDASSLLKSMSVAVNGSDVAGSEVAYDGLQKSSIRLLSVASNEHATEYGYDARGRVRASSPGIGELLNPADFRNAQERTPQLDDATKTALQSRGIDTIKLDPPSTNFDESNGGHKIKQQTRGAVVRPFAYNGAERIDDGRFTYEFDVKGRLIKATEKNVPRRYLYQYSGTGRVIGRRVEAGSLIESDTTYVWDPISDRLVEVVNNDGSVEKQIIHGDAAYDDPLETTTRDPQTNTITHLYPIFDESGAGTLQAVLNDRAEVVARNIPNDPYGAENAVLRGPAIDRIEVQAKKDNAGAVTSVEITIHATEALAPATTQPGSRLASVDNKGAVTRTVAATPTLPDPYTLRWILTPAEWQTLLDPTPVGTPPATRTPASVSIAVTSALRTTAWSASVGITPPPEWVLATKPVHTSSALPVEIRESFGSLSAFVASVPTGSEQSMAVYTIPSLTLLGGGEDGAVEGVGSARFQALPFQDGGTGLIYARGRWYDPFTGTFLSPDPMGYGDSANLYSFCGGDPINCRDPLGLAGKKSETAESIRLVTKSLLETFNESVGAVRGKNLKKAAAALKKGLKTTWGTLKGDPESVKNFNKGVTVYANGLAEPGVRIGQTAAAISHPIRTANELSVELSEDEIRQVIADAVGPTAATAFMFDGLGAESGISEAPLIKGRNAQQAEELVSWVDEGGDLRAGGSPGMRPDAYTYQSSVPGARSNAVTGRGQAPYLEFTDAAGNVVGAKFDGVVGRELIDRKMNPVFSAKAVNQATRQIAVARHYSLQVIWELPTQKAVDAASRFLKTNNISGITVRLTSQ